MSRATTILAPIQAQHRAISDLALSLDQAVTAWQPDRIHSLVVKLRDALDGHVALENHEFYPTLNRLSAANADTERMVKLFDDNMRRIADGLTSFFGRFAEKPELDRASFEREWRSVLRILSQRLRDEEGTLHPLFERLAGNA